MATMDQKLRTLYLMDIMLERTDEEHLLNASQLCSILENEYGSYIYKLPYFNALNLLNKDALYYLYFPIFLNDKDLEDLVNNKVNINFDDGFLNKKTIYKVKGRDI